MADEYGQPERHERRIHEPMAERSTADTPRTWTIYVCPECGNWSGSYFQRCELVQLHASGKYAHPREVKVMESGGSGEVPAPWFYCETEGARTDVRCTDDCGCRVAGEVPAGLTEEQLRALLSFVHGVYPLQFDHLVPGLEEWLRAALREGD